MSQMADPSSGSTPTSPHFAATLQRAIVYAEEQAHRLVTAEHLLLALTEDPEAAAIFQRKSIDLDQLRNEIASIVSRNNDRFAYGDAGQPIYGADLLRVLNTASGAASARRPIDGSLVLAAMIADGMTPAAELIRLYGLTFEEVSRGSRPAPGVPPHQQSAPSPQQATTHPSLAAVRTSARDSVLGYRQRAAAPTEQGFADEPVQLPPPLPRSEPPTARPGNGLRRQAPAPETWNRAEFAPLPPHLANGAGHANGHWQETYDAGGRANGHYAEAAPAPDPRYGQPVAAPVSPAFQPTEWNGHPPASQPQQSQAPASGGPEWSQYDYPEAAEPARYQPPAGQWPAVPMQHARAPEPAAPEPSSRRPRRQDAAAPVESAQPKTRGRKGGRTRRAADRGVLTENIPRRLQVGMPVMVEARVARQDIEMALADTHGLGPAEVTLAQAMTVRLRSEGGGVAVEAGSPETQWIDGALGILDDDFASWRWTLTPQATGAERLQLIISARAVSEEGLLGDMALPGQTVDVRVIADMGRRLRGAAKRMVLIAAALLAGGLAEHLLHPFSRLMGH